MPDEPNLILAAIEATRRELVARLDGQDHRLDRIEAQTTATNGRVSALEKVNTVRAEGERTRAAILDAVKKPAFHALSAAAGAAASGGVALILHYFG